MSQCVEAQYTPSNHVSYQDQTFEIDGLPVKIFPPQNVTATIGGILFFHGGDWLNGSVGKSEKLVWYYKAFRVNIWYL